MHANTYVVSAHKATAVTHCVTGHFTGVDDLNLFVAKCNKVEIYLVTPDGLKPIKELNIYGKIDAMMTFKKDKGNRDLLFVLTTRFNAMILECCGDVESFEVVTQAHGNVGDKIGKRSENGVIAIIDPDSRVIGLRLYDGLFKIIPLQNNGNELKAVNIRMEEVEVQDIKFLHNCSNPTIILVHQDVNGRHIKTHEISLKDKEFIKVPWKQDNVEPEANILIPVSEPLCGSILIGQEMITYHDGKQYIAVAPTEIKGSTMTCYSKVDKSGLKYLLGNIKGQLFMLLLDTVETVKDGETKVIMKEPKIELLGEIVIPECIVYLDNGVVFIGSMMGDSQLIRLNAEPDSKGSYITVLDSFLNLGPILDMAVVDLEKQGQGQLITCSGGFKEGTLRVIRNGIGINESAVIDLPGIKGMWALSCSGSDKDDTIVLSFVGHTRVLSLNGEEVEETELPGICCDKQTLHCSNVSDSVILQVTTNSARLISIVSKRVLSEWKLPCDKIISVVASNGVQMVCASGSELYYLEVITEEIVLIKNVTLEYEISCLDISLVDGKSKADLVAVGLWTVISCRTIKIPSLEQAHEEVLNVDIIARSVLLVTFEGITYMMCALGDGSMFYFTVNVETGFLGDKKKVIMGTQPVMLRPFLTRSKTNVFACSDRPSVIYSSNKKLAFSNVNLKLVNHMCPINTEAYADSLAMATDTSITIGKIDEIQKLHITAVQLGEAPKRIVHQESSETFGVLTFRIDHYDKSSLVPSRTSASTLAVTQSACTTGCLGSKTNLYGIPEPGMDIMTHNLLIIDQHTFEVIHARKFTVNEYALSIDSMKLGDDPTTYFVVGTSLVNPEESEPKIGRIILFSFEENKLVQVAEKEMKGAVYTLRSFNGKLLAGVNSTVRLFEWTAEKELRIECSHFNNILVLSMKTKGDFVLVGDLMRSITVLQYKAIEGNFEEIARDYIPYWTTAVDIIDDDKFISAENNNNIIVCQKDSEAASDEDRQQLIEKGLFHLGDQINVFRHGSLVMKHSDDTLTAASSSSILYGTVNGSIGMVLQLPDREFNFLHNLESRLEETIKSVGKIEHQYWRSVDRDGYNEPCVGVVDGDLIESFLDLPMRTQENIANEMKDSEHYLPQKEGGELNEHHITVTDIVKLVEELSRMH